MRKIKILLITVIICGSVTFSNGCSSSDDSHTSDTGTNVSCGTYNGHTLYKGPNGGCYYYNSSQKKVYVDASHCQC